MLARTLRQLLLAGVTLLPLQADTFSTYFEMEEARKAGKKEEAYRLNLRLVEESIAEGHHHYTFIGYYRTAFRSYEKQRYSDCLAQITSGIQIFEAHKENRNFRSHWFASTHLAMWELMERCHTAQLRPGEGWKAQRKATELWHLLVDLPYHPGHFDVAAISKLGPDDRGRGWRQISREASYLHEVGRTSEARNILHAAIAKSSLSNTRPHLYEVQLLDTLGIIESFIGYKENAINLGTKQVQQIKTLSGSGKNISLLGARLNLANNRAIFEGPTAELTGEAQAVRKAVDELDSRISAGFQRQLDRLDILLAAHSKTAEELEELAAQATKNGDDLEAFYLHRNALFIRARSNGESLDSHFQKLLEDIRLTGKKRSEPRIYRNYGDWLCQQERYGEALGIYHEALSLTRSFEWHPMVPLLFGRIGLTYQFAGQEKAANDIWHQLDAYLQAHPEIPAQMILKGRSFQLASYLRAGRDQEANKLISNARALPHPGGLRAHWLEDFSEESVIAFKNSLKSEHPSNLEPVADIANLHPRSLDTVSLPGTSGSGIFHLINHGSNTIPGILTLEGPGTRFAADHTPAEPSLGGDLNLPNHVIKAPLALAGGSVLTIPLTLPFHDQLSGEFTLTWTPDHGEAISSKWTINWGGQISESVILESANLATTSFIGLPLVHHVGFPENDASPQPIRLKSPTPLRIEYRDFASGNLLAVDANGDGDFTGQGEFAISTTTQTTPEVKPLANTRLGLIEMWLYPLPQHPWNNSLKIQAELLHEKTWQVFATDILKID